MVYTILAWTIGILYAILLLRFLSIVEEAS